MDLINSIAFIIELDKDTQFNLGQYILDARQYDKMFFDNAVELGVLEDQYISHAMKEGIEPKDDLFLGKLNTISRSYNKLENRERYSIALKEYVIPIKTLVQENLNDERAIEMKKHIEYFEIADSKLRDLNKMYKEVFNLFAGKLEKKKESLAAAIKYFENK